MANFPVVPKGGLTDYQAATAKLSPELREALLRASAKSGLSEDDPLWGLLASDAELMQAFLTAIENTTRQTVTEQAQQIASLEGNLTQRLDRIQKERIAADVKQSEFLNSKVEEIRCRETKLAGAKAASWQRTALKHTIAAVITASVVGALAFWLSERRVSAVQQKSDGRLAQLQQQADERYWAGLKALDAAAKFIAELNGVGGNLKYTYTPTQNTVSGIVINFGSIPLKAPIKSAPNEVTIALGSEPTPTPAPPARQTSTGQRH